MGARAILFWPIVVLAACASSAPPPAATTTGLVVAVGYDNESVHDLSISGAVAMSGRRFGPYVVSTAALPPGATVGLVFDASDAGMAMVCAEARAMDGSVLSSGCDGFTIVADAVRHDTLELSLVSRNNH